MNNGKYKYYKPLKLNKILFNKLNPQDSKPLELKKYIFIKNINIIKKILKITYNMFIIIIKLKINLLVPSKLIRMSRLLKRNIKFIFSF